MSPTSAGEAVTHDFKFSADSPMAGHETEERTSYNTMRNFRCSKCGLEWGVLLGHTTHVSEDKLSQIAAEAGRPCVDKGHTGECQCDECNKPFTPDGVNSEA